MARLGPGSLLLLLTLALVSLVHHAHASADVDGVVTPRSSQSVSAPMTTAAFPVTQPASAPSGNVVTHKLRNHHRQQQQPRRLPRRHFRAQNGMDMPEIGWTIYGVFESFCLSGEDMGGRSMPGTGFATRAAPAAPAPASSTATASAVAAATTHTQFMRSTAFKTGSEVINHCKWGDFDLLEFVEETLYTLFGFLAGFGLFGDNADPAPP